MRSHGLPLACRLALILAAIPIAARAQCNPDTSPPVIKCPPDLKVQATGDSTPVGFTVSATDACGAKDLDVAPPSGSGFPVGTTRVIATAVDNAGNRATCTFNVTVEKPTNVAVSSSESSQSFPAGASITTEAFFGGLTAYFDGGAVDRILVFDDLNLKGIVQTPNFGAVDAATTDTGVVFIGQNISTNRLQIGQLDIDDVGDLTLVTKLALYDMQQGNLSQGATLRGDGQGNYCGFTPADGTAFLHSNTQPDDALSYFKISGQAVARDAAMVPGACLLLTTGVNGISRLPLDGSRVTFTPFQFTGTGLAVGTDLFVPDGSSPIIHRLNIGFEKTFLSEKGQIGILTPVFAPFMTPTGFLGAFFQPRDLTVIDTTFSLQKSFRLSGTASIFDIKLQPSSPPVVLVNEFDKAKAQGIVQRVQLDFSGNAVLNGSYFLERVLSSSVRNVSGR